MSAPIRVTCTWNYSKLEFATIFLNGKDIFLELGFLLLCNVYNMSSHVVLNIGEQKANDCIYYIKVNIPDVCKSGINPCLEL